MALCKCESKQCGDSRNQCLRFRIVGNEHYQPYAEMYEPHPSDPSIKCINFIAIEDKKNLRPIDGQSN